VPSRSRLMIGRPNTSLQPWTPAPHRTLALARSASAAPGGAVRTPGHLPTCASRKDTGTVCGTVQAGRTPALPAGHTCPRVPPGRTPGRCAAQCRRAAHLPSRRTPGRCGGRCQGVLGLRLTLASSGCCAMLPEQRWDDVRDAARIPSGDATRSSRPLGSPSR